ncbi:MAG: penicillin-insensitive murein endopeptidase [Sandaracinaceae bacterium]|nr:penicillin-insensitive murein endopeptidase [Sandaracinaceae bacterium]
MRCRLGLLCVLIGLGLGADLALASPGGPGGRPPAQGRARRSRSIAHPWRGRLQDGWRIEESRSIRYAGEYRGTGNFYGTTEMVRLLERAAQHVARRVPGAKLTLGELSAERGGPVAGHRSHENGRDADVSFYMTDARGRPYDPFAFAVFGADGVGRGPNSMLRFDDARNWELVRRLVTDPDARVQHVFVATSLKNRLLREARRRRAPAGVIARAEAVMVQPSHGHPHQNHFHVRIYCDPRDRPRCRDRAPFHPWYPGTPPERDAGGHEVGD